MCVPKMLSGDFEICHAHRHDCKNHAQPNFRLRPC